MALPGSVSITQYIPQVWFYLIRTAGSFTRHTTLTLTLNTILAQQGVAEVLFCVDFMMLVTNHGPSKVKQLEIAEKIVSYCGKW